MKYRYFKDGDGELYRYDEHEVVIEQYKSELTCRYKWRTDAIGTAACNQTLNYLTELTEEEAFLRVL